MNIFARVPDIDPRCTSIRLHFVDDARTGSFLRQLSSEVFAHDYVKETVKIFKNVTDGVALLPVREKARSSHFANSEKADRDVWENLNRTDFNGIARSVLGCSRYARTGDILFYRRTTTRRLLNLDEIVDFFKNLSYDVQVLDAEKLSPEQQICALSERWKAIVSPHGAQQAPLLFKHSGTKVFEVTPTIYFEGNRCFVRPKGGWFKIYGERAWECDDECSEAPIGRMYTLPCSKQCRKKAKLADVKIMPGALLDVARHISRHGAI
jgi:hypothetical protein